MTLALNATADNDLAAVLLQVTGAAAGPVTITRVDSNGTGTVRLMPDQEPITGTMTVYDYEVALQGDATYTVLDSASATATDAVTMAVEFPILMTAVLPNQRQHLTAVIDYDASRESASTVHQIIGRSDPLVVTTSPMRTRQGSFTVYAGSYEDAHAIMDATASGEVLLFRQPTFAGMDEYFIVRRVSISPQSGDTTPRRWEVVLERTEVRTPDGPLLSAAGWNFDAVTATFATFGDLQAAFVDFNAMTVGP